MKSRPCLDCTPETGRKPGCHSKCEDYISYKRSMEEKKAAVDKAREEFYGLRPLKFKKQCYRRSKHGEV